MELLHAPAAGDELGDQVIEQFEVIRANGSRAEVEHRIDQRLAEVPGPDVVDSDACGKRIGGTGDPASQRRPTTGRSPGKLFPESFVFCAGFGSTLLFECLAGLVQGCFECLGRFVFAVSGGGELIFGTLHRQLGSGNLVPKLGGGRPGCQRSDVSPVEPVPGPLGGHA